LNGLKRKEIRNQLVFPIVAVAVAVALVVVSVEVILQNNLMLGFTLNGLGSTYSLPL